MQCPPAGLYPSSKRLSTSCVFVGFLSSLDRSGRSEDRWSRGTLRSHQRPSKLLKTTRAPPSSVSTRSFSVGRIFNGNSKVSSECRVPADGSGGKPWFTVDTQAVRIQRQRDWFCEICREQTQIDHANSSLLTSPFIFNREFAAWGH